MRPDASVTVPETITGRRSPVCSISSSSAKIAALAFSVSKMVSTRNRSAPPSSRPAACSWYAARSCVEVGVARARVVDVGADAGGARRGAQRAGDEARPVGRRCGVGGLACDARRRHVHLARDVRPGRSPLARCDVAPKVLVSIRSAPAARYSAWISRTTSGRVRLQQVVVAAQVVAVVGEARAAVVGLRSACSAASSCPSRRR